MKKKNLKMYDHDPDAEELRQGEKELSNAEDNSDEGKELYAMENAPEGKTTAEYSSMLDAHNEAYKKAAKARSESFRKSEEDHAAAAQQAAGDKIVADDAAKKEAADTERRKNGGYAADQHINN